MKIEINTQLTIGIFIACIGISMLLIMASIDKWKQKHIDKLNVPMWVLKINHSAYNGRVKRNYPVEGSVNFRGQ